MKLSFGEMKQRILAMDDTKLSETRLRQLLLYAPDNQEVSWNTWNSSVTAVFSCLKAMKNKKKYLQ